MKLGFRLNLILALLFILAIVSCGSLLSYVLERKVEQEIANKASLAIETMNAVRSYTSDRIQPELSDRLILEEQFLPETVPAYSAREVFERLRENSEYRNFSYKEATINPTNPIDKADKFESILMEKFRTDDNLQQLSGFRVEQDNLFYIARPLKVNNVSCLQCHSLPESAPSSLINTYGDRNGFGWRLNEIVATQIIYIPASSIARSLNKLSWTTIGIVIFCLGSTMIIISFFLQNYIIKPIEKMASLSNKISLGATELEFTHINEHDELGILAKALNRMKLSFHMAEKMLEENEKLTNTSFQK
jgi:HAMP domain-containing protein